jgi:thymidylate synthase (FAD)
MNVEYIDHMGDDLQVVNSARVSFDKKSSWEYNGDSYDLSERDQKLIKYLAKEEHTSPFGHCFATFLVKAPIFVRSQLVKHEYLRMNEVSRRYVDTTPEFFKPEEWRAKALDKKQGSSEPLSYSTAINMAIDDHYQSCLDYYEYLLSSDVAPEQARMVLPQSMYTEWYWSGSLDAFANMCNLRCKPDAQQETRNIAELISKEMSNLYPHSWKELTNG